MKDAFKNELSIGDTVAFMEPGYTYELKVGTIIKFTPKKLLIAWLDNSSTYQPEKESYKFPEQVAKGTIND